VGKALVPGKSTNAEDADVNPLGGVRSRYPGPRAQILSDTSQPWWRRILPVIASHRIAFAVAVLFSFISLVVQNIIPLTLGNAIKDDFPTAANSPDLNNPVYLAVHSSELHHTVIVLIVLGLLVGASGLLSRQYVFYTAYNVEADLRSLIYEHLSWLSFSFYDRVQSGQLISRANSDIRSVQMYSTFAPLILVQVAAGVMTFGFMLFIDWRLAIVAMAVMPFLWWIGVRMRQMMFPISWITQSRLADVATIVDENVNGVRVVKSFAQEEAEVNRMADAAERVAWSYIKDAETRGQYTPLVQNLPQLGLALVLLFGGWMVVRDHLPVSTIIEFNIYLLMLQAPFMMMGQLVMMGQRAKASAERIFEILDETPDVVERPGAYDLVTTKGEIAYNDVHFTYNTGPEILKGFSAKIESGETVAIVGRTGSGKSTIARLLDRFYDVTGGSVTIDGHDVRDVTLASLRDTVGVVLDEPFLFSVSIAENIAYGRPSADIEEIVAAAKAANAHEFIVTLPEGYDTVVGERGYTLSGGQRQRIAIARTLLVNPPILILDDATSAIDVHIEAEIHDALTTLLAHRTTIVIAHRISTIALASRVILLENGRVFATGSHAELLASTPLYAEVLAQTASEER
jgi:ATP-binding cassette, subfamily B, bacterial